MLPRNQGRVLAQPLQLSASARRCDRQAREQQLARPACKLMLLCRPHNPSGKAWTRARLEQPAYCANALRLRASAMRATGTGFWSLLLCICPGVKLSKLITRFSPRPRKALTRWR
ncbi:aminotransferase class I/II-fold pyridoxal phosphate-dependent enzyme [Candidatus Pantoea deserta]|uniref:Aminotransferase class I/II-fold pyridoxal phosphate-dependent enzyme n=1 Tax=Candidatus Pantoea deserta TaxID=1869313 RepID=A0A3N4NV63_9GAMM|nr:aminotransferase class I/II-fold pyridoxal phosphate-dependent enzyme [Pantoea deserta]